MSEYRFDNIVICTQNFLKIQKEKKLSVIITSLLCKHTVRLLIRFPTASTLLSLAISVMYIYIISITI